MLAVDADGERLGLTVGSVISLSLEPPLVGVSVSRQAAMHELLRNAGAFALSLLAGAKLANVGVPLVLTRDELPPINGPAGTCLRD